MAAEWFSGILVPVTTPFDPATFDVEVVSFRENLRRWVASPIDGVVLFGSTGEGVLLDEGEKLRLVELGRDLVPPEKPLVAGVDAESTRAAVRQARVLGAAGAHAVLVHPPAYFGVTLSPAALRDHFLGVADGSPVPVLVYHIPKYTHVTLEAGLMAELARHPNIAGIKDSSGDLKRFAGYTEVCRGECKLLIGSGALLYSALELGADGGIVAVGLLAPDRMAEILAAYRAGDAPTAGAVQERMAPVHREVVAGFGARGVKVALELLGWAGGPPRPPLQPLSDKERRAVARVMQEAGLV